MADDMLYDGKILHWYDHDQYKATSGFLYRTPSGATVDHQVASDQTHGNDKVGDSGPIPEGRFYLSLSFSGEANVTGVSHGEAQLDLRTGIESLPKAWKYKRGKIDNLAWGPDRVRLIKIFIKDKDPKAQKRDGFYLHDSAKGYTHGCIEVERRFFADLRAFAASEAGKRKKLLSLKVEYPSKNASTYGGTWDPEHPTGFYEN